MINYLTGIPILLNYFIKDKIKLDRQQKLILFSLLFILIQCNPKYILI
jgi:hypothetical protein